MAVLVSPPFSLYPDRDGSPLEAGFVYIGQPNEDPQTNPQTIFFDVGLTIPAPNPFRTLNGFADNYGTQSLVFAAGDYSIRVCDKRNVTVSSSPTTQRTGLGNITLGAGDQLIAEAGSQIIVQDGSRLEIGTATGLPARIIMASNARVFGDLVPGTGGTVGREDAPWLDVVAFEAHLGELELNADGAIDGVTITNELSGGEVRSRRFMPISSTNGVAGTLAVPFNSGAAKTFSANTIQPHTTAQPTVDGDLLTINARAMHLASAKISVSGGSATLAAEGLNVSGTVNYATGAMQVQLLVPVNINSRVQVTHWVTGTPLIVKARMNTTSLIDIGFVNDSGTLSDPLIVNVDVFGPGALAGVANIPLLPI